MLLPNTYSMIRRARKPMLQAELVLPAPQPKPTPEKEVEVEKPAEGQLSESEVPEATEAQPQLQAGAQQVSETVAGDGSDSQVAEKPKTERRKQKPS